MTSDYGLENTTTQGNLVVCSCCGIVIPPGVPLWENVAAKGKVFCSRECALQSYWIHDVHYALKEIRSNF